MAGIESDLAAKRNSTLFEKLSSLRAWLVQPHPAIDSVETRNQVRFAAALNIVSILLGVFFFFVLGWFSYGSPDTQPYPYSVLLAAGGLGLLGNYGLSRSRYGRLAAVFLVLIPLTIGLVCLLLLPVNPLPFYFLAYGILMCGLLLSLRLTMLACGFVLASILLFFSRTSAIQDDPLVFSFWNLVMAGVLANMVAALRDQYREQIREQAVELKKEVAKYKQAEITTLQMASRGEALARSATRLNAQLDFERLLNVICEETINLLHFPATSVTLYDSADDRARFAAFSGLPKEYCEAERRTPHSIFEKNASQMGSVIIIPDVQSEHLADADLYARFEMRTIGTAAMTHDDELIGGLHIYSLGSPQNLDENERALFKGLADQSALAIVNARLFSETENRLQQVQALHQIDRAIIGSTDLVLTLNTFIDEAMRLLKVDAVSVFLFNPASLTLEFAAGKGFNTKKVERSAIRAGEGPSGRAILERRMIRVPDLNESGFQSERAQILEGEGFVSYFGVPLIVKGEVKGILDVFNRTRLEPDEDWLKFLDTLAGQAAIAVVSATLFSELQRRNFDLLMAYDTTLEGWSHALDLRDKETEGHTRRVTSMALQLAKAMGLNEFELTRIRRGALLHDIGKMGVPDHILLKHSELSPDERKQIEMHPVYAYEMLSPIEFLHEALDIPYCHHEKWDGSGYPRGLKGDQIPLAARIFAVVDVWDAITSDRPYRKGWKKQKALEYLRQHAGTSFDTKVVDVFLRMVELS